MALAAAAALLTGCAGAPAEEAADRPSSLERDENVQRLLENLLEHRAQPEQGPVPDGYRLRRIGDAGLSIALPPHWHLVRGDAARAPGAISHLGDLNIDLGSLARALAEPDSPLKAFAFDGRFRNGYATTATLVQWPVERGDTFADWSARVVAELRALPSLRSAIAVEAVRLPAGDALRLEYRKINGGEGGRLVATVQWILFAGDRETILTFTTLPRLQAAYAAAFDRSAGALQAG